jgi:hypothetical protein
LGETADSGHYVALARHGSQPNPGHRTGPKTGGPPDFEPTFNLADHMKFAGGLADFFCRLSIPGKKFGAFAFLEHGPSTRPLTVYRGRDRGSCIEVVTEGLTCFARAWPRPAGRVRGAHHPADARRERAGPARAHPGHAVRPQPAHPGRLGGWPG